VRARCAHLTIRLGASFTGIGPKISIADGDASAWVILSNEELMIAQRSWERDLFTLSLIPIEAKEA
jgi:hypothetical protein